jgi:hypothetical protein
MVLLLLLGLLPWLGHAQAPVCGDACQAFQWSYPIWKAAQVRFGQSSTWVCNEFYPFPSPFFSMNNLAKRRAALPTTLQPTPRLPICNSKICSPTPNTLNGGPVVAPNVDTIYGGAQLDVALPLMLTVPPPTVPLPTNPSINLIGPNDLRFYGVSFIDAYSNVVGSFNRLFPPGQGGGRFCLYSVDAHSTVICDAVAAHAGFTWQGKMKLPRYVTAIARAWSTGLPSGNPCLDPQTNLFNPGIDGCNFLEFMTITNITAPPADLLDPWTQYKNLMAPVPGACGLSSADNMPCSHVGANRNAYWDAVCKVLRESPPSAAEAAYIDVNFAHLGIHSNGQCTPDYATLNAGFESGYGQLASLGTQEATGAVKQGWVYLPFSGQWASGTAAGLFLRAVTAQRLFFMEPNTVVAYWARFTDSTGNVLDGTGGAIYKITFPGGNPPISPPPGFWSMTVYEQNWFLHGNAANKYTSHSLFSNSAPPTIYLSNTCAGAPTGTGVDCIPIPATFFRLLFRAYAASAALAPTGNYILPTVARS